MSYSNELDSNNKDLQVILDTINGLPEAGGEPNNQDKTITENGTYTADEGYTGLGTVTVDVQASGGDIDKLINSSITELKSNADSVKPYAFYRCEKLVSVELPLATSLGDYAFYTCSRLTNIVSPSATRIGGNAFEKCTSLSNVDFPLATQFTGGSVFKGCTTLKSANFPLVASITNSAFYGCSKLTDVVFQSANSVASSAFYNCVALTSVDFPATVTFQSTSLTSCKSLVCLVLRSGTVCTMSHSSAFQDCYHFYGTVNTTYNPEGLKDGYIYVPRALVEDYKAATNWSDFATQFRALEDYTVDGTITGALDESKI